MRHYTPFHAALHITGIHDANEDTITSVLVSFLAALILGYMAPLITPFGLTIRLMLSGRGFLDHFVIIAGLVSRLRMMREEALSSVNRKLIDAEERVRGRIGKELHDDIEQRLAPLAITAAQLSGEHSNADGAVLNSINQIREQTAKISGDVPVNSDGSRTFQDLFHLLEGVR